MTTFSKLLSLLDHRQKTAGLVLFLLMLIAMVLETAGIGLIIPVLAVIADPNVGKNYPVLQLALDRLGGHRGSLVVAIMAAMVLLYAAKNAFLAFLAWYQAKYVFAIQASMSRRLYAGYLSQPFLFHMQRNSALLLRNITTGVQEFSAAIMSGTILASECLVLIGVTILLLLVEPIGAILVGGSLGAASFAFYRLTHNRILRWGAARQYHEGQRLKQVQQGLGGIREVKLLGRERQFVGTYDVHNSANAAVGKRQSFMTALPRLWLELLTVVGLALLVLVMLYQGKSVELIVPSLGLFAAAAFRFLPSMNKTLNAIQNLRYNLPIIDTLYAERDKFLDNPPEQTQERNSLSFNHHVKLERISFRYPNAQHDIVTDVSLEIEKGRTIGFFGPSGAGKSTLVNLILGLLPPSSGRILVDDVDIQSNLRRWQISIGYVPQAVFLVDDTLRRNIAFGLHDDEIDEAAVQRAVRSAQLADFVDSLPEGLDTMVGERGMRVSGGQGQRISIARALYCDAPIIVLDEASSALDTETEKAVMATVDKFRTDKTILIVAHRLATLANCDELYEVSSTRVRRLNDKERNQLLAHREMDGA